ncbi:uncharacterized protein [Zea mays]|uniref:uncharacterized protein n=1 Tax=Zea mays TaxID=4577 RepID=UPI0004DEB82F|nr:uncharacterized protein LOC118476712 [Zea mays]
MEPGACPIRKGATASSRRLRATRRLLPSPLPPLAPPAVSLSPSPFCRRRTRRELSLSWLPYSTIRFCAYRIEVSLVQLQQGLHGFCCEWCTAGGYYDTIARNEMPLSENELEIGFLNNCSTAVQRVGGHVHHVASCGGGRILDPITVAK